MLTEEILNGICRQRCDENPASLLAETLQLLDSIDPGARQAMMESFALVAFRALETRLLADSQLRALALYWRARAGEADALIAARVEALTGKPPSDELRLHLRSCVRSRSSREGQKEGIPPMVLHDTVASLLAESVGRHLRCTGCGYHFLEDDLGGERRLIIDDLSPTYATTRHPRRLVDSLKPWQSDRGRSLTSLTIDHVTPEAGFGWTGSGNHAVLCYFCNYAKAIYRSPAEPISTLIAGSLQADPADRAHSFPRQLAVWSIIATKAKCDECERGPRETELTLDLPDEVSDLRWLTPWTATVVCYDCLVARDHAGA